MVALRQKLTTLNQSAGAAVFVFALELTLFAGAVLLALTSCTPLH